MSSTTNPLPNLVNVPKGYAPLNPDGTQLANLALWHVQRIGNTGMLAATPEGAASQPVGTVPNPAATQRRVWLDEPPGSVSFDEAGTLAIPPASTGTDFVVLTVNVPKGFDGVIKWISNNVLEAGAGNPFVPGELIWKIEINGRPARNYGNITVEKGSIAQGREISPLRVFSGDVVTYTVQQPAGQTSPTGQTVCSLSGYYYPSRGVS